MAAYTGIWGGWKIRRAAGVVSVHVPEIWQTCAAFLLIALLQPGLEILPSLSPPRSLRGSLARLTSSQASRDSIHAALHRLLYF